ncbi:MAG: hypothetical protein KGJ36_08295, partial [Acidobacteriota bacterium]|nr:hypothetical protein [Acidobacteriota bacterium]
RVVTVVALSAATLVAAGEWVARQSYFRVHHVTVTGAVHESSAAVLAANLPTPADQSARRATWPFEGAGRPAAVVAGRLPPAFASQVSIISVSATGIVSLKMTTPVTFRLGTLSDLHAKFVAVASVIAHETLRPGDVVDVSVPGALAVSGPPPS